MSIYTSSQGNGYHIECEPPPIPTRSFDWQWSAEDYDGAPDSNDRRCGCEASREDCILAIEDLEADE